MADITDITVEAGFGSTMFTASPTWTDITAYVRRLTTSRGRTSLDGRFRTGTGTLILDNRDGRFNPDNTSGAYYPDVQIGVPIRVTLNDGMTTHNIFYGGAREWPPAYPKSQDSYATVSLADGFYNLHQGDLHGNSYSQETTDTRIGNVLDDVGWPAALRDLDAGVADVQATTFGAPQDGGEQPALAHLLDVAEAEVGTLWMSADGKVTFRNRVANSGATASVNFTDSNMSSLTVRYDDDYFFNDIRIAREDGAQIQYVDATSVTAHGRRVLTKDVMPMSNDAESLNIAEWLAAIFGTQRLRIDELKIKPLANNAGFLSDVLGIELRDYVNVTHTTPDGDTINQDCAVEAIRHDLQPGDWTTTFSVAPLAAEELASYWILGTSQLDTETRLA